MILNSHFSETADGQRNLISGWLKAHDQCAEQDKDIQPHAPIGNIPAIEFDAL